MSSMALWYSKAPEYANQDRELEAVINFNLWSQCDWANDQSFLDIGILLTNLDVARELKIFLPFTVTYDNLSDLGRKIASSPTISAIFNENYSVPSNPKGAYWPVTDNSLPKNAPPVFTLYSLHIKQQNGRSDIALEQLEKGTILTIPATGIVGKNPEWKEGDPVPDYYIRLRVKSTDAEGFHFIRAYRPRNSFLQSTISNTYIIDFRFNYIRSLDQRLTLEFTAGTNSLVKITKLHFLLLTKAHVDVVTGQTPISLRELEQGVWCAYVEGQETADIVAYHCRSVAKDIDHPVVAWEFFSRLRVNRSTRSIVLKYLFFLALFTVLLNLLSSCTYDALRAWFGPAPPAQISTQLEE